MTEAAVRAAETVARTSYGRLVAFVAARTRDLAAAEDALADAFARALETWPRDGVPEHPEAWLLAVARRRHGARTRTAAVAAAAEYAIQLVIEEAAERTRESDRVFPDERLKLLFVCAHPAIESSVHTPLMLQTVLGLDAARIAAAFLVPPATMSQRLVRAKSKIKAAGVRFEEPGAGDVPARLEAVLEAILGCWSVGWDGMGSPRGRGLAEEALHLGRALVALLPQEPEPLALLAVMLYQEARLPGRRDPDGRYVPLDRQDTTRWHQALIAEADAALARAGTSESFGRFKCMSAIEAVHAARARTGRTDKAALDLLYEALARLSPTIGVFVARAAARGANRGAAAGLALLDAMSDARVRGYQPYWAVRASLLAESGAGTAARDAFDRAIALCDDTAVEAYLATQRAKLSAEVSGSAGAA